MNQSASTKIQCRKRAQWNTHVCRNNFWNSVTSSFISSSSPNNFCNPGRRLFWIICILETEEGALITFTFIIIIIIFFINNQHRCYLQQELFPLPCALLLAFSLSPTPLSGNDHLHSINATESNSHNQTIQRHSQFAIIIATTTNIVIIVFWMICILETFEGGSDHLGWCRHKGKFPPQSSSLLISTIYIKYRYFDLAFIYFSSDIPLM